MTYEFDPKHRDEITKCFGYAFMDALPKSLADYSERWGLSEFRLVEYYSVNCLFYCKSAEHGDCVLKIFGCEYKWFIDEICVIRELDGKYRYVRAYESDEGQGALLLERIKPGTTLKQELSLERRIEIFADIWKQSQIAFNGLSKYKAYLQMTEEAAVKQWENGENQELRKAARLMTSVCGDLYSRYPKRVLLHADLHGDNLLKNENGDYVIVDPHAKVGPPICDLGRFIANEFGDAVKNDRDNVTMRVVSRLSELLKLPYIDITRAFFVDITLMTCWDAENVLPNLDGVRFAEMMLAQLNDNEAYRSGH